MNTSFYPNVPNGRAELLSVFGPPIKLATDPQLAVVVLPERIGNVEHIHVHNNLKPVFDIVFASIRNAGYWKLFQNCMGAWVYRDKRTMSALSLHSWGIAIDFNTLANPQGMIPPETYDESRPFVFTTDHPIVKLFRAQGFLWGGDFKEEKDAMHFQYATGC